MTAKLKRGFLRIRRGFSSRPSALITQLLILTILGAMTVGGMNYVTRQEDRMASAGFDR
jgi:Tfp pilus assembly protein PilX